MLDKSQIKSFVDTLDRITTKINPDSKFQVAQFEHEDNKILVYKSGIIIFDAPVAEIVSKALKTLGIQTPNIEIHDKQEEIKEFTGWEHTPRGVWLSDNQLAYFVDKANKDTSVVEIPTEKNERYRFQREHQLLVINRNNVVYTIGGFDYISEWLRETVLSDSSLMSYDKICIINIIGQWRRIGPVVLCVAVIEPQVLLELQLQGIKHSSLSRINDIGYFKECTQGKFVNELFTITPQTINSRCSSKAEYQIYLNNEIVGFLNKAITKLKNQIKPNKKILLEAPETLTKTISDITSIDATFHIKYEDISMPLSLGSMICQEAFEKWRDTQEKMNAITISRKNYKILQDHPQSSNMMKLFL